MKHLLILITGCCLAACSEKPVVKNGWQQLDFGVFSIKAPPAWYKIEQQGIDSYVGGLTNGRDTLQFDYGLYSAGIGNGDGSQLFGTDTVNGLPASFGIPVQNGTGVAEMHIKLKEENKFYIYGSRLSNTDTILKIFSTVVFKQSDTARYRPVNTAAFSGSNLGSGRRIFSTYCASCHALYKTGTGPALTGLPTLNNQEWMFTFLTNRKLLKKDTAYQKRAAAYQLSCVTFPIFTRTDVAVLMTYLSGE